MRKWEKLMEMRRALFPEIKNWCWHTHYGKIKLKEARVSCWRTELFFAIFHHERNRSSAGRSMWKSNRRKGKLKCLSWNLNCTLLSDLNRSQLCKREISLLSLISWTNCINTTPRPSIESVYKHRAMNRLILIAVKFLVKLFQLGNWNGIFRYFYFQNSNDLSNDNYKNYLGISNDNHKKYLGISI